MNETSVFPSGFPSLEGAWASWGLLPAQSTPYYLGIAFVTLATFAWTKSSSRLGKLPYVNPPKLFSNAQAKAKFLDSTKDMLLDARRLYPNQPYRMTTDYGEVVMVQSEWMEDIRNTPSLSFIGTVAQERICEIPGFEPLAAFGADGELVQLIAKKQLTKLLAQITEPMCQEAAFAASQNLGESPEWRELLMVEIACDMVARVSSRVLLGEELARNGDWLEIMKGYTLETFKAVPAVQRYPVNVRPYIGWLIPSCRRVREYYGRSRQLIDPVMEAREAVKQAASQAGRPLPVFNDALGWLVEESKDRNSGYDAVTFQLIISVVSLNTTADLLHTVLVDLMQHPEYIQAVREEIVRVLREHGWKKSSLYNMKLLDSVIKESQRIKPIFLAMRRSVEADTELPDGTLVKKGARLHIDTHRMVDAAVYEDPEAWKGDRFLRLRSRPGKEHSAQLVSTGVDHFGFGHGLHACPGRFFASNELKVVLCHLLMKYDWRLAPGTDASVGALGFSQRANPATKVLCRRRGAAELELDIDAV